jgi:NTE family protein
VSAGAAAAALIANGVTPDEILRANLARERPYYFERRDIFVPAMGEGFKSIPRAVRQFGQLVQLYVRNRRDMGLIDLLEKAQQSLPGGFYTLDPFARYLETTFASKGLSNTFNGLQHPLYIPAIDLDSGRSVIFGEDEWRDVPISKAITASSAAPIYFCPVRIGGREYIDAGIGRIPCFDLATQKAADLMVIIHPSSQSGLPFERMPAPDRDQDHGRHRGFLSIADVASRINLEARLGLALDHYQREHPDKFFVVTPCENLIFERSFLSFRDRMHLLRCGYLSVVHMIKKHLTRIGPAFARHGLSISVAKIEERMKIRIEQLSGLSPAPSRTLASSPVRAGWSSTF